MKPVNVDEHGIKNIIYMLIHGNKIFLKRLSMEPAKMKECEWVTALTLFGPDETGPKE